MEVVDVAEPRASPAAGEVIVARRRSASAARTTTSCSASSPTAAGGSPFPRIQGHEVGATIAARRPGLPPELAVGRRVALFPLHACGHCYPCSVGPAEHLRQLLADRHPPRRRPPAAAAAIGQAQVYPIDADDAAVAAMAEPLSVAVRAVHRARVERGEKVVVLGAGPIGQCVALLALERGAEVLLVDLQESPPRARRASSAPTACCWTQRRRGSVRAARDWAGGGGPPVVVDATGAPRRGARDGRHGRIGGPRRAGRDVRRRGRVADRQLHGEGDRHARRQLLRRRRVRRGGRRGRAQRARASRACSATSSRSSAPREAIDLRDRRIPPR